MSISGYVEALRKKVGHDLLLVPGVAAIIRDQHGRILLQKTKDGQWNLPAGAIDPGEKAAQAIVREVFEETGLIVRPVVLIGVLGPGEEYRITYDNGDVVESTTLIFGCERVGGELKPQDDETAKLEFVDSRSIPKLPIPIPSHFFTDSQYAGRFEWHESWLNRTA